MKTALHLLAIVAIFNACSTAKNYTTLDNNENVRSKVTTFSKTSSLNIVVIVDTLQYAPAVLKNSFNTNLVVVGKEYFQDNVISDLQYSFDSSGYLAKFYTEKQAKDQGIKVDWKMKLKLTDLNVPLGTHFQTNYNPTDLNVLYEFPHAGLSSEVIDKDFNHGYTGRDPVSSLSGSTSNSSYVTVLPYQPVDSKIKSLTFLRCKLKVNLQNIDTGERLDLKPLKVKRQWEFDPDEYVVKEVVNGKEVVLGNKNKEYYNAIIKEILKNIYAEVYPYLLDTVTQKML